jgi:hypothetical protein
MIVGRPLGRNIGAANETGFPSTPSVVEAADWRVAARTSRRDFGDSGRSETSPTAVVLCDRYHVPPRLSAIGDREVLDIVPDVDHFDAAFAAIDWQI